jgi:transcription initiation factor TFIIIB Brf1 subunit/transcription initiation factor TFIIB
MCDHASILDDFRRGDAVCVDCGRVMTEEGPLLGGGFQGGDGGAASEGSRVAALWRRESNPSVSFLFHLLLVVAAVTEVAGGKRQKKKGSLLLLLLLLLPVRQTDSQRRREPPATAGRRAASTGRSSSGRLCQSFTWSDNQQTRESERLDLFRKRLDPPPPEESQSPPGGGGREGRNGEGGKAGGSLRPGQNVKRVADAQTVGQPGANVRVAQRERGAPVRFTLSRGHCIVVVVVVVVVVSTRGN